MVYSASVRLTIIAALSLVLVGSLRIASTYKVLSFTIDEPGHFACGLEFLSKHVYRYETQHPPLARVMIALLPYLTGVRPVNDPNRNVEGRAVILRSGHPGRTLALMRLGTLPFFWLACLVVFVWGRHYFGDYMGLAALGLFTLLPPVLAHAGMACTDMALGAGVSAAFLALCIWSESSNMVLAVAVGVTTGLAVLSKFTALLYLPWVAAMALFFYLVSVRPSRSKVALLIRERVPGFALAVFTGAIVVWGGYLFSFGRVAAWNLSLPAPELFDGLLAARAHDQYGHPAYLLGMFSMHGWWYYFPVVLAVKTPIAFLLLAGVGVYACVRDFARARARIPLAFSLGILIPAMAGHVDIGVRLILPLYVSLAVLSAVGLLRLARVRAGRVVAGALLVWICVSGALSHPDYLAYFNEFARHAPDHVLVDSDLDWGQGTVLVARRLRELKAQHVAAMMLEPLTLPIPIEKDLQHYYELPEVRPVDVLSATEGWSAISPTVARTLGLKVKPWYEKRPPTETVGDVWLYYVPPRDSRQAAR